MSQGSFPTPPPVQPFPQLGTRPALPPRRKKDSTWLVVAAVLGVLVAGGIAAYFLFPGATQQLVNETTTDPDLKAVRRWLSENLDNPSWTEIRWWPCKVANEEGIRVCRIKLRTKSSFGGGQRVVDLPLSVTKKGKVGPIPKYLLDYLQFRGEYPFDD